MIKKCPTLGSRPTLGGTVVCCKFRFYNTMCLIKRIVNQAFLTFQQNEKSYNFTSDLEKLLALVKCVTPYDVCLKVPKDDLQRRPFYQAPASHIGIYEGSNMTICMFIIRKGESIPLHDHPEMIGICKVLYGNIKIKSYQKIHPSIYSPTENEINAIKLPDEIVNPTCDCKVLTSHDANYHSLTAVGGDAAILDILSPPYSESKDCHYYKEVRDPLQIDSCDNSLKRNNQCKLIRVPQPLDFYCDSMPYEGPGVVK